MLKQLKIIGIGSIIVGLFALIIYSLYSISELLPFIAVSFMITYGFGHIIYTEIEDQREARKKELNKIKISEGKVK